MVEHEPAGHRTSSYARIAVVGAGLSGLTAACELHRSGYDVLVLEAADRVGGRVMRETSPLGSSLDLGGQWIGRDHHRVAALATELGLTQYRRHARAVPRIVDGATRVSPASPSVFAAGVAVARMAAMPQERMDVTLGELLRRLTERRARRLLEIVAQVSWAADPDRLSVRAVKEMVRRQGGLRTILSADGGAQHSLLVEGAGALVDGLRSELGPRVRTCQRVLSIRQERDAVVVRTASAEMQVAKVIVTAPPPTAARIAHEPALPPERVALERNTYMGSVYKAIAVYRRPFWRDRGGGDLLLLGHPGGAVFDTTQPDGPGHLCILMGGREAHALDELSTAERRAAVLDPLAPQLGADVVSPVGWHEKAWHLDPDAGGGYIALPEPGTTEGFLPMPSTPFGHVHWAGAETAADHPGYLDGAVESGHRAAREVMEELERRTAGRWSEVG